MIYMVTDWYKDDDGWHYQTVLSMTDGRRIDFRTERDWRGAHLGVWTAGNFAWYPLRMHGGNAVFRVDADGPLYADGGGQTFKFVSYRAQGHDRPASGT